MSTAPSTSLAGLTRDNCATACNIKGCVISGQAFCLHPCKMSFPESLSGDEAAKAAYDGARAVLGLQPMFKTGELTP